MIEAIYTEFQECRKKEVDAKITFNEKDIRISYWNGACEILRFLYTGLKHLELSNYVNHHRILLNDIGLKESDLELQKLGHSNMLNSKMIIDAWSNFELLVTLLCEKTLSQAELEKIKDEVYNRVIKTLPVGCKTADTVEKLKYLKKEYIAHSSIPRKYNALFKITKQDYLNSQKKADRKFLIFLGKLRNCIHSNFIYFGRYSVYQFNDERFTFQNNKTILIEPNKKETIFELFKMLNKVAERIIKNIEYAELIYDPSYDLM